MYIELLQRCKQMYLTEAETADDNVYQLPSFLQSIASVIFHLDTVSGLSSVTLFGTFFASNVMNYSRRN